MPDLKFHFLAPEVTRDLRRAFILSLIGSSLGMRQHEHMLRAINQMDIAAAHVFDMGRLFDLNNPDCIKNDVGIKLLDQAREFQIGAGLRLPHQKTLFLSRGDKPGFQWGFWACYAVEDAGLITINTFLYESSHKQWSWAGFSVVDCIDHSKSQPHQSGQLSH